MTLSDENIVSPFDVSNRQGLWYFNYETGEWNRDEYMGYKIQNQDIDTKYAIQMKQIMDLQEWYRPKYRLAACVLMAGVGSMGLGTHDVALGDVRYDANSRTPYGTIISRDINTGAVIAPNAWVRMRAYGTVEGLVEDAASRFAFNVARYPGFREFLRRVHGD